MPGKSLPDDATRVRTGLVLITALTLLAGAAFFLDLVVRATAEGARVTVLADAAPELRPGSAVWVAGRPVGRVLSIAFRPPGADGLNIVIRAALERSVGPILRADASVEVKAPDLLAPVIVSIDPGAGTAPPFDYADTLRTAGSPSDQQAVMALADSLLATVGRLETQAADTRRALTDGAGSLQRLSAEPEVLRGIQEELGRARDILARDLSRSSLVQMASDTLIGPATRRIQERLAVWNAAPEREASRRSLDAATEALDAMGVRLETLMGRLDRGEGTAGRALVDGEIQRQLEALRSTIAKLTDALSRDPSRWLRVRIF